MATATEQKLPTDSKYDQYDFPTTAPGQAAGSGHPGHTTEEQDKKVHELRALLESEGYTQELDTLALLRFLRARKFDVEAAKAMYVRRQQWLKETDVNPATWEYPEKKQVSEYYPQYYHSIDKDGRPVYIEKLGKIDLNAMYKITTDKRMLKNLAVEYEKVADPRLPACSRKAGKLLETCCTIMDLKGVGITSIPSVYGYVRQASEISQNYYPERLGKLYLINAPWGFSGAFSAVKGFLDPVTVDKIHVLGSGYQKELLAQVPKENLPVEFGGTCNCEGGCEFSDVGPWQDPEWARTPAWAKEAEPVAAEEKKDAEPAAVEEEKKDAEATA